MIGRVTFYGWVGAVILGCVVYGIQLGWGAWLWGSMFDVFWVLFGLFSLAVFLASGFNTVCLCAWFGAFGVYWRWLSYCSLGFLFLVCVRTVLVLLCPLYNPVGVVLLSFCVGSLYSLWSFTRFCAI